MRISFVIPAYNAEKYLARSLNSIAPLLMQGHEAVAVDDGSTDSTPSILADFAQKHPNVTIVTQANAGQSVARNVGIRRATGDYVWFLDADDYIDNPLPDLLQKTLVTGDYDVLVIGRSEEYGDSSVAVPALETKAYASGIEYFRDANLSACYRTQPWDKLVRRSLLIDNNIGFAPGMMFEDMFYCLQVLAVAGRTAQVAVYPYHYVLYNAGSLTKLTRPVDYDALTATEMATAFLDEGTYDLKSSDLAFQVLVYSFISSCLLKKYIPLSFKQSEAKDFVDRTMRHPLFRKAVRHCALHPSIGLRRWGMALCIWISPRMSRHIINRLMH